MLDVRTDHDGAEMTMMTIRARKTTADRRADTAVSKTETEDLAVTNMTMMTDVTTRTVATSEDAAKKSTTGTGMTDAAMIAVAGGEGTRTMMTMIMTTAIGEGAERIRTRGTSRQKRSGSGSTMSGLMSIWARSTTRPWRRS